MRRTTRRSAPPCPETGKKRFRDEAQAREVLAVARGSKHNPKRQESRVYPCQFCNGWHLSSQPDTPKVTPKMPK